MRTKDQVIHSFIRCAEVIVMATEPGIRRIAWGKWLLVLLIGGVIGGAYVWWVNQPVQQDMTDIYSANLVGIGLLDRFEYAKATSVFEEIHKKAPHWIPGREIG